MLSMLFLLNDVVFDLDETCPVTPGDARRFEKLGFDYVLTLGCELFAEDPLLHHNDPERARRLAWLIHCSPPGGRLRSRSGRTAVLRPARAGDAPAEDPRLERQAGRGGRGQGRVDAAGSLKASGPHNRGQCDPQPLAR